jgi:hypothetical protein
MDGVVFLTPRDTSMVAPTSLPIGDECPTKRKPLRFNALCDSPTPSLLFGQQA